MVSVWKGSEKNFLKTKKEIEAKFGQTAAAEYNPLKNCFTYAGWMARNYRVKSGERGIKIQTLVEKLDRNGDKKLFPRTIHLFSKEQVERINSYANRDNQ